MVEIAKVLSRDPQVVIFDEATSALGRAQAEWLLTYARRLAARGKIVIYISHKLSEIRQISDRITVFRNGHDVGVRNRGEATTDESGRSDSRTPYRSSLSTARIGTL